MSATSVALIHSPLTSAAAWGDVPRLLEAQGYQVVVPEVFDDLEPPYAARFIARVALQLADAHAPGNLILVGHGDAGPLLPHIGSARRAAGHPVSGYVFVDAFLPRTPRTINRLDLWRIRDEPAAAQLRATLEAGDRWPDWAESELAPTLSVLSDRAMLLAGIRPRPLDYFTEPLPLVDDWPDARCAFLQLSADHSETAATAHHRGWATHSLKLHTFAMLSHPQVVSDILLALLAEL